MILRMATSIGFTTLAIISLMTTPTLGASDAPELPALPVAVCDAATAYDCGVQIGTAMSERISSSLQAMPDLLALADWATITPEGRTALASLEATNKAAYPDAWAEMEGISVGSGVERNVILTTNLAQELEGLRIASEGRDGASGGGGGGFFQRSKTLEKHCTDVHLVRAASTSGEGTAALPALSALAHNEDDEQGAAANGYLVAARISGGTGSSGSGYEYCGFAYPGALVGWAWGFSGAGVAQTVNAMSPANQTTGKACALAARDALQAVSLADAVRRIDVGGLAAGLSFNLGQVAAPAGRGEPPPPLPPHYNVETSPGGNDVLEIAAGNGTGDGGGANVYYHTNVYLHDLGNTADLGAQDSSWHRLARLEALPPPASTIDMLLMLGDTEDPEFPIYRNQTAPDYATTLNSLLLDFGAGTASVWPFYPGGDAPWAYSPGFAATGVQPRYIFDLRGGFESWVQTAAAVASAAKPVGG